MPDAYEALERVLREMEDAVDGAAGVAPRATVRGAVGAVVYGASAHGAVDVTIWEALRDA